MIKVLVIEPTRCGYDGITNVIKNYFLYQDDPEIQMDLVTINEAVPELENFLREQNRKNYVLPYRNRNPLKYVMKLRKIIKEGGYQIIHVHGCSATLAVEMLAGKFAGVKVRIAHAHSTSCNHQKVDKMLRPFFLKWCNCRFACSQEAGEWLYQGRKFQIIHNGINLEKYQFTQKIRDTVRKQYHLENSLVIGHVGRFSPEKNHKKLLNIYKAALQKQQNVKLVLVGDGVLKREIEEQAQKENLDVLFVGLSQVVEQWLQAMDVMVFPSLFEGLPLGLVEAQAAGLPCVLSDTISPMSKVTDDVTFLKLNDTDQNWADVALHMAKSAERGLKNEKIQKELQDADFDIRWNCRILAKQYKDLRKGEREG
ncbi:MAG: glycosyltransferase family 1 protein [[Ruminococcus] gnavus]|nr:glycosyltransferase family 1 protein [Mediterraneibacter gnavus]